jgi:aryl-alcohol dehydrogenase-like predicted oxidoreductase
LGSDSDSRVHEKRDARPETRPTPARPTGLSVTPGRSFVSVLAESCYAELARPDYLVVMEQRQLGKSGLSVSVLTFGTMTIGGRDRYSKMGNLGVDDTIRVLDCCREAGVTTIDTADAYSFGAAEEILGQALRGRREDFVLVTKAFMRMGPAAHDTGLSRKHLMAACEASLRRLGTDYLDLYICHEPDQLVPVEETLRAYEDLVRQGKVRYIGCSNHSAWHAMKAIAASERLGVSRYICQQVNYSLISRDVEHEIVPLALDQSCGLMAWSPLHAGLLSGKFRRGGARPEVSRLNELDAPGTIDYERLYRIVDVLEALAAERGVTPAQVALNWVLHRPGVDTVIIGARNEAQLKDNLAAAAWRLTPEESARLDDVSALPEPYPMWHQHKFGAERNPRQRP